jgi:predicted RNA-binding Zn ribbon-like protein
MQPDARSPLSQAQPPSRAGSLALVGGALCLDFANTSSGRGSTHRQEHLRSYDLLLVWCEHAGILSASERSRLSRLAAAKPSAAAHVLRRALALREAIHAIGAALAHRAPPPAAAVATVNRELGAAMARAVLRFDDGGFVWDWASGRPVLDQVLWPLARSAADLLTGPTQGRIKQCPGQHCGWVFLDRTKNRRRRWCEMEVCGARAKIRRYRERRRRAAAPAEPA